MPITTNWLVSNHTEANHLMRYSYTTTGTIAPWTLMNTTSTTTTYSVSGTTLNNLSWAMDLNPGYDAPVYTDDDYYAARQANDAQIRAAFAPGYTPLHLGHVTPAQAQHVSEREQARVAARDRARGLLLSLLTEEQQASYERDGHFEVIGSVGGVYRIRRGTAGNVDWIDPATGRVGAKLCAHPRLDDGGLPEPDVAVGQMLALQTDEPGFLKIANVHAGRRPPTPSAAARLQAVA